MEGGPLLAEWWVELSKEFVPYLNISAQLSNVPDQSVIQQMGGRGYPYFVVLTDRGERIVPGPSQSQFRPQSKKETEAALRGAIELIAARVLAAEQPESTACVAAVTILESLLIEGRGSEARLAEARAVDGVDPQLMLRLGVRDVVAVYTRVVSTLAKNDQAGRSAAFDNAARSMLAVHGDGPGLLDTRLRIFGDYWRLVFTGALQDGKLDLADEALRVYRRVYGADGQLGKRVDKMTQDLDAARTRAGE